MVYLIVLVFVVVYLMLTHNPATRVCRWRKDRARNREGQVFWTCDYCGAERFTDGAKPDRCARPS